jgi:hypothetical protein
MAAAAPTTSTLVSSVQRTSGAPLSPSPPTASIALASWKAKSATGSPQATTASLNGMNMGALGLPSTPIMLRVASTTKTSSSSSSSPGVGSPNGMLNRTPSLTTSSSPPSGGDTHFLPSIAPPMASSTSAPSGPRTNPVNTNNPGVAGTTSLRGTTSLMATSATANNSGLGSYRRASPGTDFSTFLSTQTTAAPPPMTRAVSRPRGSSGGSAPVSTTIECDNCDNGMASFRCNECANNLCLSCNTNIHRPAKQRSHRRHPLNDSNGNDDNDGYSDQLISSSPTAASASLLDIIEPSDLTGGASSNDEIPFCDQCHSNPAAVYCPECNKSFCDNVNGALSCGRKVHKPGVMKHHQLLPIATLLASRLNGDSDPVVQRAVLHSRHPSEMLPIASPLVVRRGSNTPQPPSLPPSIISSRSRGASGSTLIAPATTTGAGAITTTSSSSMSVGAVVIPNVVTAIPSEAVLTDLSSLAKHLNQHLIATLPTFEVEETTVTTTTMTLPAALPVVPVASRPQSSDNAMASPAPGAGHLGPNGRRRSSVAGENGANDKFANLAKQFAASQRALVAFKHGVAPKPANGPTSGGDDNANDDTDSPAGDGSPAGSRPATGGANLTGNSSNNSPQTSVAPSSSPSNEPSYTGQRPAGLLIPPSQVSSRISPNTAHRHLQPQQQQQRTPSANGSTTPAEVDSPSGPGSVNNRATSPRRPDSGSPREVTTFSGSLSPQQSTMMASHLAPSPPPNSCRPGSAPGMPPGTPPSPLMSRGLRSNSGSTSITGPNARYATMTGRPPITAHSPGGGGGPHGANRPTPFFGTLPRDFKATNNGAMNTPPSPSIVPIGVNGAALPTSAGITAHAMFFSGQEFSIVPTSGASTSTSNANPVCHSCEESISDVWCETCKKFLCASLPSRCAQDLHESSQSLRNHIIVRLPVSSTSPPSTASTALTAPSAPMSISTSSPPSTASGVRPPMTKSVSIGAGTTGVAPRSPSPSTPASPSSAASIPSPSSASAGSGALPISQLDTITEDPASITPSSNNVNPNASTSITLSTPNGSMSNTRPILSLRPGSRPNSSGGSLTKSSSFSPSPPPSDTPRLELQHSATSPHASALRLDHNTFDPSPSSSAVASPATTFIRNEREIVSGTSAIFDTLIAPSSMVSNVPSLPPITLAPRPPSTPSPGSGGGGISLIGSPVPSSPGGISLIGRARLTISPNVVKSPVTTTTSFVIRPSGSSTSPSVSRPASPPSSSTTTVPMSLSIGTTTPPGLSISTSSSANSSAAVTPVSLLTPSSPSQPNGGVFRLTIGGRTPQPPANGTRSWSASLAKLTEEQTATTTATPSPP